MMNTQITAPEYDTADASYLFLAFTGLYRANHDSLEDLIESCNGEHGVYSELWTLAIESAQAISAVVDFEDGRLGMFAYEHLNTEEPGTLPHKLFWSCFASGESHSADEVVTAYARAEGWPMIGVQSVARTEYDKKPDSIQVVKTIQEGEDTEVCAVDSPHATHWSIYVRGKDGLADWFNDYSLTSPTAELDTMQKAAELSTRYGVPIEPIR